MPITDTLNNDVLKEKLQVKKWKEVEWNYVRCRQNQKKTFQ